MVCHWAEGSNHRRLIPAQSLEARIYDFGIGVREGMIRVQDESTRTRALLVMVMGASKLGCHWREWRTHARITDETSMAIIKYVSTSYTTAIIITSIPSNGRNGPYGFFTDFFRTFTAQEVVYP